MSRTLRNASRGHALITTLIFGMLFLTLGVSAASLAVTNNRVANQRMANGQASSLAIGGIDEAIFQLKQNKKWPGFGARNFGAGTVAVSTQDTSGNGTRIVAESTGNVVSYNARATRRVRATFSTLPIPPVYYNAIASKTNLVLNGNITTGSVGIQAQGNVHSNGTLTLNGTAITVDGRATSVGTTTVSGSPTVTRGMESGVPPMVFPEVDPEYKEKSTANGSYIGSRVVSDGSTLRGKITGNLQISNNLGARIDGIVWVTGNIIIDGPVYGKGVLICDGSFTIDARMTYPTIDTSNLMFISTSTSSSAISIGGNRQFKGILYAPYGGINVHGTPLLWGNLLADRISISGTPDIMRWTDFDDDPIEAPSFLQLVGWEEF